MPTANKTLGYDAEFKTQQYKVIGDERGALISIENNINLPFEIKRVYYIYGTAHNITRGKHAHKRLKQLLICTSGSCKVYVDDRVQRKSFLLDRPDMGLYINGLVWHEMYDFSPDCVLMVLASDFYDESDYIRSYTEFCRLAKGEHIEQDKEFAVSGLKGN